MLTVKNAFVVHHLYDVEDSPAGTQYDPWVEEHAVEVKEVLEALLDLYRIDNQ